MTFPLFKEGSAVKHALLGDVVLTVAKVTWHTVGPRPTLYELVNPATGQHFDDVNESDLRRADIPAEPATGVRSVVSPAKASAPKSGSGPGWVFDAKTGQCLGPASYEMRDRFEKGNQTPMLERNLGGCDRHVIVRQLRPDDRNAKGAIIK